MILSFFWAAGGVGQRECVTFRFAGPVHCKLMRVTLNSFVARASQGSFPAFPGHCNVGKTIINHPPTYIGRIDHAQMGGLFFFNPYHFIWADPRYQQDPSLQSSENLVDALPPSQLPSWMDVPCVSPNCANEEGCDCISGCTCRSWTLSGTRNFYGLMATLSMQPN